MVGSTSKGRTPPKTGATTYAVALVAIVLVSSVLYMMSPSGAKEAADSPAAAAGAAPAAAPPVALSAQASKAGEASTRAAGAGAAGGAAEAAAAAAATPAGALVAAPPARAGVVGKYVAIKDQGGGRDIEMVYSTGGGVHGGPAKPLALLFLAHGCSGSATDFFDKSEGCAACIGQAVERHVVREALKKGFAVVAVSSEDREGSKCWSPRADIQRALAALAHVQAAEGLQNLKVVAIGASSGGGFVAEMGASLGQGGGGKQPAAVAVQIMAVPPERLTKTFPPAVFWHMPRDEMMAPIIKEDVQTLKDLGRPVMEVECPTLKMPKTFFSDWTELIDPETSAEIVASLAKAKILGEDGFLTMDPRHHGKQWRQVLREEVTKVKSGLLDLKADKSSIPELLNTAYGQHSWCATDLDKVLEFLLSHTSDSSGSKA